MVANHELPPDASARRKMHSKLREAGKNAQKSGTTLTNREESAPSTAEKSKKRSGKPTTEH